MRTRSRSDSLNLAELLRVLLPRLILLGFAVLNVTNFASAQQSIVVEPVKASISMLDSTREQDGLVGPVRRVHTEMSRLSVNAGKVVEEPRMLLEVTTYDPQGKRIWNVYYPVNTGSFKGNQEFAYDEQGHVKEMTLRDDAGRVLSREAYVYEYDGFGNWTKMSSSLVIFEGGKLVYEPFELTSRAISYYFDDSVAKIVKSPPSTTESTITSPVASTKVIPPANENPSVSGLVKETSGTQGASLKVTTSPSLDNSARPVGVGIEKAANTGQQAERDIDVSAGSGVQAYQVPSKSKTATTSTKPNVSGGVISGRILSLSKPVYPAVALTRGVFGKVVVEVTLDETGKVVDARVLSGNPMLRLSAVSAARMARFEPTLLSGQPVKATRLINFDFNGK